MKGDDLDGRQYREPHRRLQPARLPERQDEGVAAQGVLVRQRRRPGRRRPRTRTGRSSSWKTAARHSASGASRSSSLRVPLLFNLRRDPFEKSQHNSNTYNDWFLDRAFVLVPIQGLATKFLHDHEGLSAEPVAGLLQSEQGRGAVEVGGRRALISARCSEPSGRIGIGSLGDVATGTSPAGCERVASTRHREGKGGNVIPSLGISRRFLLSSLAALPVLSGPLSRISAQAQTAADPLASWNDGRAKQSILDFVAAVTREGSPDFVPAPERIATFDNDGTLWCEQPMYVQLAFLIDRMKALAPQHPDWSTTQPFSAVLAGDIKALGALGEKRLTALVAATHAGMTTVQFADIVSDWLAVARHPRFDRLFTELVYQPMLEVLAFLRVNGFKTFIVSGGGVEFMRPWTDQSLRCSARAGRGLAHQDELHDHGRPAAAFSCGRSRVC